MINKQERYKKVVFKMVLYNLNSRTLKSEICYKNHPRSYFISKVKYLAVCVFDFLIISSGVPAN
jgi:hypothetical protein